MKTHSFLPGGAKNYFALLSVCFASLFLIAVQPAASESILWRTLAPMPTPRYDFGTAVVDGKVYAIGGFSGSTLAVNEMFDPETGSWTEKAPMPTPRALLVVAAVQGKIYAIGGAHWTGPGYDGEYSYATEEYDPATDSWSRKSDLPLDPPFGSSLGNAFIGGTAVDGKILVVVFNTETPGTTATYEYDPALDAWRTDRAAVPFSYTQFAAASLDGRLYVAAISDGGGPFEGGAPFAEYDATRDLWIVRQATPTARRSFALAANDTAVYAVGGSRIERLEPEETFFEPMATVERYNPQSRTWSAATPMPTPRHSPGVAAIGDKLYVLGGAVSISNHPLEQPIPLDAVEEGTILEDEPGGGEWITDPSYPDFRFRVAIIAGTPIQGSREPLCQPETVCVSGALPGRSELFIRVIGPRPNGYLWPTLVRFTPSRVEVDIEQISTGILRTYALEAVAPGDLTDLSGIQDRRGFLP